METKKNKCLSLKFFLIKKSTLFGWIACHILSVFLFAAIFHWTLLDSLFFVTIYGPISGDPSNATELIMNIISLIYFLIGFLVYTFNLYQFVVKKYAIFFKKN